MGSEVVFDCMLAPSLLTPAQRSRFDALARQVAPAGEPWQASFDPALLTEELHALGFGHVEDNGPEEINARYFEDRKDGLRMGNLSRLMKAQIRDARRAGKNLYTPEHKIQQERR